MFFLQTYRHSLQLSQDLNTFLAESVTDGMAPSQTAVAGNLSDMQLSSLKVLVRMMEQFKTDFAASSA